MVYMPNFDQFIMLRGLLPMSSVDNGLTSDKIGLRWSESSLFTDLSTTDTTNIQCDQ